MIRCLSLIVLLSLVFQLIDATPLSIDAVTLLLPVSINQSGNRYQVKYPIHAFGSCFTFQSLNQSIAVIEPIPSTSCSIGGLHGHTGALVSSALDNEQFQGRVSTRIIVQSIEQSNNQIERVELWIDSIDRISPKTTSRNLKVNHYETIELFAYDDQSNTFSSIEGLPFDWNIQSIDQSTNQTINQSVFNRRSLRETRLNVSQSILDLESHHHSSSLIVGVGETSGIARVKASFNYPSINQAIKKSIKQSISTEFDVIIVEEIELSPVISAIAPGADLLINAAVTADQSISQSAKQSNDQRFLTFPHPQYRFVAMNADQSDASVVSLNELTGQMTGRSVGESVITLIDRLIDSHREQAQVTVSKPHSIVLSIKQSNGDQSFEPCEGQFSLKPGQSYILTVRLMDQSNRLMTITPNMKFDLMIDGSNIQIPDDHAIILSNNQISTKQAQQSINIPFTVIKQGPSSISVSINQIKSSLTDFEYVLDQSINQSINVIGIPPMSIFPVTARMPWVKGQSVKRQISVTGGSGHYEWTITDPKVAKLGKPTSQTIYQSINQTVTISPLTRGVIDVIVRDKCSIDQSIKSHITFVPAQIEIVEGVTEVQALDTLTLRAKIVDLGVKSPKPPKNQSLTHSWTPHQEFSDCSDIQVSVKIDGPKFLVILSKQQFTCASCHCPVIIVQSNNQKASSSVKISLSEDPELPQSLSVPVSISKPITCQETEYEAAVGSPIIVRVDNGPLDRGQRIVSIKAYSAISLPVPLTNQSIYTHGDKSAKIVGKEEQLDVVPVRDKPNHYYVTCHTVSHRTPLKMVIEAYNPPSTYQAKSQTTKWQPSIPLHARSLIPLYCYPRMSLAGPISVSVGGEKKVQAFIEGTTKKHPLANDVMFSVEDLTVATVTEDGKLTGQSIGRTNVVAELPRLYSVNSSTDGLVARTNVQVEFGLFQIVPSIDCSVDCLIVENQSIAVHIESDCRAHPGQSAFGSVQCIWSVGHLGNQANNQLRLTPLLSMNSEHSISQSTNHVIGTSAQVTGLSAGLHTIFAAIHVGDHEYSINQTIRVFPEFKLIKPVINQSKMLLPFGVGAPLVTSHDQSKNHFEVTSEALNAPGLITIDQSNDQSTDRSVRVRPATASNDQGQDSVILLQSRYQSIDQTNKQTNNQSLAVHVSVRPVAALLVRVDESINPSLKQSAYQPLSIDQSVVVSMIITDSFGRMFDYSVMDDHSVKQSDNPFALSVSVNDSSMLIVEPVDIQSIKSSNNQTSVVGCFRITVHPSIKQSKSRSIKSSVITVSLKHFPRVKPVYIETYVETNRQSISQSNPQLITMKLKLSDTSIKQLIEHQDKRDQTISQITHHISRVAGIEQDRLIVQSVDLINGWIELSIAPSITQSFRPDQWFLIDQFPSIKQSNIQLTSQSINQTISQVCDRAFDAWIDMGVSPQYETVDCLNDCSNERSFEQVQWIEPGHKQDKPDQETDHSRNSYSDIVKKITDDSRRSSESWPEWFKDHKNSLPIITSLVAGLFTCLYVYYRAIVCSRKSGLTPSFKVWLKDGVARSVYSWIEQPTAQSSAQSILEGQMGEALTGVAHRVSAAR